MKRIERRIPFKGAATAAAALVVLGSLAGCGSLSDMLAGDKVNYSQATAAPPLKVPGDLTSPPIDKTYVAPPVTSVGNAPKMAVTPAGNSTLGQPTSADPYGMHVVKDRDQHWLVVDGRSPEELWPILVQFWTDNGFVVVTNSPATGVMETDWAENRAKIPGDWFHKTFGKLVDGLYSSGTRDKFRTRVEHAPDGSTAIFITHRGMEEMAVGRYQETTRWEDRPRDPNLELAFMGRLMEKFGLTNPQTKTLIVNAQPAASRVLTVDESSGSPVLVVNDPIERTWLRVGLALDRSDFLVDDSNRSQGYFMVRYSNPVKDNEQTTGLFTKLFGGKKASNSQTPLRVSVRPGSNGATQIAVQNAQGGAVNSAEARKLMTVLKTQLS